MSKVWIELEKPLNKEHAEEQCRLANNMLRRLMEHPDNELSRSFFYLENERRYGFGGHMGYVSLTDNGEWLNLDYLGRDLE